MGGTVRWGLPVARSRCAAQGSGHFEERERFSGDDDKVGRENKVLGFRKSQFLAKTVDRAIRWLPKPNTN